MLTPEQVRELKEQLFDQVKHLSPEQRHEAERQINDLSPDALEEMLSEQKKPTESVLRMLVNGTLPSKRIDENKYALALLDIKPVTKGHVLIIPKQKIAPHEQLPTQAFTLAKKIARRMRLKLKPKGIEIQTETKFEEQVLNVIPYYEKPVSITSPRYEAKPSELEEMERVLAAKKRKPTSRRQKAPPQEESRIRIKRRIP